MLYFVLTRRDVADSHGRQEVHREEGLEIRAQLVVFLWRVDPPHQLAVDIVGEAERSTIRSGRWRREAHNALAECRGRLRLGLALEEVRYQFGSRALCSAVDKMGIRFGVESLKDASLLVGFVTFG